VGATAFGLYPPPPTAGDGRDASRQALHLFRVVPILAVADTRYNLVFSTLQVQGLETRRVSQAMGTLHARRVCIGAPPRCRCGRAGRPRLSPRCIASRSRLAGLHWLHFCTLPSKPCGSLRQRLPIPSEQRSCLEIFRCTAPGCASRRGSSSRSVWSARLVRVSLLLPNVDRVDVGTLTREKEEESKRFYHKDNDR
jgi:hypothetical protein